MIFAGGMGTRISEESHLKPKPMIEIGTQPILWHIMKHFSYYGVKEFIILAGYKSNLIKEYFAQYFLHRAEAVTFDLSKGQQFVHGSESENWKVTVVDTGVETMTGGRLRRARNYIGTEPFFLTYGDGLSDVNLYALAKHHKDSGAKVTLTAVQPSGRFGRLGIEGDRVSAFHEKPRGDGSWINGGFFVVEPEVIDIVKTDQEPWEDNPMRVLVENNNLAAYQHYGFWQPMDTMRDRKVLEDLWGSGKAPWRVWKDA